MRVLVYSDTHIGQGRESLGDERLADQESVLDKIADLVEEERPDVVAFLGDAFEKRRPRPDELAIWGRHLRRLAGEPCDVIGLVGNHCVEHADRVTAMELFGDLMDVRREPGLWRGPGIDFAFLPWCPVARLVAAQNGGDRDDVHAHAAELLVDVARGLRAECGSEGPAVLLAHWSVSGSSLPSGLPVDQLREVVLPGAELEAMGWDAVVLGHIHKPQPIFPGALYVGSPMPLNHGEASCDHGVWIVDVDVADGETVGRFLPIASREFVTLDLDADTLEYAEFPLPSEAPIVRLRYRATEEQARRIDNRKLMQALYSAGAFSVSIHPEIVREQRARVAGVDEQLGEEEALRLYCVAQDVPVERAEKMAVRTSGYLAEARS